MRDRAYASAVELSCGPVGDTRNAMLSVMRAELAPWSSLQPLPATLRVRFDHHVPPGEPPGVHHAQRQRSRSRAHHRAARMVGGRRAGRPGGPPLARSSRPDRRHGGRRRLSEDGLGSDSLGQDGFGDATALINARAGPLPPTQCPRSGCCCPPMGHSLTSPATPVPGPLRPGASVSTLGLDREGPMT